MLKLLNRWREEAEKAGRRTSTHPPSPLKRRDGFWLAALA